MYTWVKCINSFVITDRERDVEVERMSRYILNEVETSHMKKKAELQLLKKNMVVIVFRN
jgi:hypothetical protein